MCASGSQLPRLAYRTGTALLLALSFGTSAHAQRTKDTAIQGMRLQGFLMGSYVNPDFGGAKRNAGATIGGDADLSVPHLFHIEPGLDIRYVASGGRVSRQYVFSVGPRVVYDVGRLHPYANLLIGKGTIKFERINPAIPEYTQDESLVWTYGGGLDYSIGRSWALRGEVESQRWRLSDNASPFHPLQISAGLRYQFHFRNHNGPE